MPQMIGIINAYVVFVRFKFLCDVIHKLHSYSEFLKIKQQPFP